MPMETILKVIAGIVYAHGGTIENITYTHLRPVPEGKHTHGS